MRNENYFDFTVRNVRDFTYTIEVIFRNKIMAISRIKKPLMFSINYLILKMLFQKTQKLPYFISLVHIDDVLLNDTRFYHQNYGDFV